VGVYFYNSCVNNNKAVTD